MGQDNPAVKKFLLAFGQGAVTVTLSKAAQTCTVWVFDHTSHLKYLPMKYGPAPAAAAAAAAAAASSSNSSAGPTRAPISNGHDFVMKHFMAKPMSVIKHGARYVYICLDRGSPVNKSIEHGIRYKKVNAMATPINHLTYVPPIGKDNSQAAAPVMLINDYQMPCDTGSDWRSFIANPYLYRCMIYYITMRLIGTNGNIDDELTPYINKVNRKDFNDNLNEFCPPPYGNPRVVLHGGRLEKPDPNQPHKFKEADSRVLEFSTETLPEENLTMDIEEEQEEEDPMGATIPNIWGTQATPRHDTYYKTERRVMVNTNYKKEVIENLLEGEVAALYYAQSHIEKGENVMIVTPDIDVLMMLLLSTPDRLDPITGSFTQKVFVCLQVSTTNKTCYVDVHQLWFNIQVSRPTTIVKAPSPPTEPIDSKTLRALELEADATISRKQNNTEYVTKISAMCLLCGTDYVKNYCEGISTKADGLGPEMFKNSFQKDFLNVPVGKKFMEEKPPVPWVVCTFIKHYEEFKDMIVITRHPYEGGLDRIINIRSTAHVDINEDLFIDFTYRVYIEFYSVPHKRSKKSAFLEAYGTKCTSPKESIKYLKKFLYEDAILALEKKLLTQERRIERLSKPGAKQPKNPVKNIDKDASMKKIETKKVPTKKQIRVLSRHLLWQMEYMMNSYKGSCSLIDPTTIYLEMPYYGWILDGSGRCEVASRVSLKRPSTQELKEHIVKKRRRITASVLERHSAITLEGEEEEEEEESTANVIVV